MDKQTEEDLFDNDPLGEDEEETGPVEPDLDEEEEEAPPPPRRSKQAFAGRRGGGGGSELENVTGLWRLDSGKGFSGTVTKPVRVGQLRIPQGTKFFIFKNFKRKNAKHPEVYIKVKVSDDLRS